MHDAKTVTRLLRRWREGDEAALGELMTLVYDDLHNIAERCMRGERPAHTLRPTDLVSEAYLRLSEGCALDWGDRSHFLKIAARMMRQVLVDSARRRCADKRGGGGRPISFDDVRVATDRPEELLALDEALSELARVDERRARAVELFYFGGLSQDEIATMQEVHANTVGRDLRFAEAWISRYLGEVS